MINKTAKTFIIIGLVPVIAVALAFFVFVVLPWLLIGVGTLLSSPPPKPEITYGEFPFEITYQIKDEIVTIKDIYVCEYDGIGMNEGTGKYRKWKGYIKSTGEKGVLVVDDTPRQIFCSVGNSKYYMDDRESYDTDDYVPYIYYVQSDGENTKTGIASEGILSYYDIKIIDWKLSEPIENSFK